MAHAGLPALETLGPIKAEGLTIGVVTASWNQEICDQLHRRAVETVRVHGAKVLECRVAGALELSVVAQRLAATCDAVVALGCVIRGGTPHFDYVCDAVTYGLQRIALDERTPVGNGVLTTNDEQQARDRAGFASSMEDKGADAALAALHSACVLAALPEAQPRR